MVYTDEVARIVVDMAGTREGAQEILKMWSTKARGPKSAGPCGHATVATLVNTALTEVSIFGW